MRCVFCEKEISDYALVNLDIITNTFHQPFPSISAYGGSQYVGVARQVAFLECPHCDMAFFVKADSPKLKGMDLNLPANPQVASSPETPDYSRMTAQEKRELYEKMKEEIIEKFESDGDDTQ